jgi:hypothetical protein
MTLENTPIIAKRCYQDASDPNRVVVLEFFAPILDSKSDHGDWVTQFRIEGIDSTTKWYEANGVDSLQSLSLAIEYARKILGASGLELTWDGGDGTGIYRTVLHGFDEKFDNAVQRLIDQAIEDQANVLRGKRSI